jgi:hypothetical protein
VFALALFAGVGLCLPACGGKSSNDDGAGGAVPSTAGKGGSVASAGADAGQASGGAATSGGATQGGSSPGSGAAQAGSPAGGDGSACTPLDIPIALESRSCTTDADCAVQKLTACCGKDRLTGVAETAACGAVTPDCSAVDCIKTPGFVADDGQSTLDPSQVRAICQIGEPGAGLCATTVTGDGASSCGSSQCVPGELCVHLSAAGGPAPFCDAVPESGQCADGSEYTVDCGAGTPGCRELRATPEPHCSPIPAGCGAPTACACLPSDFCTLPQVCSSVAGRHVYCVDLSP